MAQLNDSGSGQVRSGTDRSMKAFKNNKDIRELLIRYELRGDYLEATRDAERGYDTGYAVIRALAEVKVDNFLLRLK